MSSQSALPVAPSRMPVWNWSASLNRQSMLLNGEFSHLCGLCGKELFAYLRILVVVLCAVSAEWHLAPLSFAGGAPLPLLASVVACYALTSSFGRVVVAAMAAGLLRDAFSPSVPFGSSGLAFLLIAALVRALCDRRRQSTPSEEFLAGMLLAGGIMLFSHGVLLSAGVHGSTASGVLLRRVLGSAFASGLVFVPLLRVAKELLGRAISWFLVVAGGLLALLGSWTIRHFNYPDQGVSPLPEEPVQARS